MRNITQTRQQLSHQKRGAAGPSNGYLADARIKAAAWRTVANARLAHRRAINGGKNRRDQ